MRGQSHWCRIAVLLTLLVTCAAPGQAEQKKWLVGFAQDTMGNDWRVAQVRSLEKAFAKYPEVEFYYTVAGGSTAQQILDIEAMIEKKVDVLITSPRDARAMDPVISRAYTSGIPVVLISRRIESDNFTAFIHPDNGRIARATADYLITRLQGKGNILVLQHIPTSTPAIQRTEPFVEAVGKVPGMKITAIKVANSLRADAIKATEEALAEGVAFDAIYAQSDSMASGAIMALEKNGRNPGDYVITGIDYISEARELIRQGKQQVSFTYPTGGEEGARVSIDILNGKEVDRELIIDSVMVTKDNVESVLPIF